MEIHIREAGVEDLKHILHHRRAMFEEMGFQDTAVLDGVESLSREYFSKALRIGRYRGWIAEGLNGQIVGGGGIVIGDWQWGRSQDGACQRRGRRGRGGGR